MKENYRIETLKLEDIDSVVSIVRESFEPTYLIPSVYRGSGISRFLDNELKNPFSPYRYFVLFEGDQVAGYAEFKTFRDSSTAFLNMIAVNNEYKNRGVGNKLYTHTKNHFKNLGYRSIALDVYGSNAVALKWYINFGFTEVSSTSLYEIKINTASETTDPISISNFPQYKALQEEYGFYFLDINVGSGILRLGTIENDGILRSEYSTDFNTSLSNLKQKLNLNKIYYIGNNEHLDLQPIDNIIRMELNLDYDN